jgi:hypothetical protein
MQTVLEPAEVLSQEGACALHFPLDGVPSAQCRRVASASWMPAQRPTGAPDAAVTGLVAKNAAPAAIAARRTSQGAPKLGCRVAPAEGGLAMEINYEELDRLGDEIAELFSPTCRLLPRCPAIPWRSFARGTRQRGSTCTRGPRCRGGWGSV